MTEHNLFQEVQDDLERQKLEAMWKRYGGWLIAAALAIVLATAGSTAYRSWTAKRDQHLTSDMLAATRAGPDAGKSIEKLQKFAAENRATTFAALAELRAGALAAEQNDKVKAVTFFDAAAAEEKADAAFRQLGDLLSVQMQMDAGDPATLSGRLEPLTVEHAPWRFSAMEDQGYLALRTGDKNRARQIFTLLSQDATVPQSIGARAKDIARSLN